jgi:hypothetical protein
MGDATNNAGSVPIGNYLAKTSIASNGMAQNLPIRRQ